MANLCACGCGNQIGLKSTWARGHQKRGANGYVALQETKNKIYAEAGVTGDRVMGGQFYTDINDDFNDRDIRLDRYEEMERADSACAALKAVISLPIRSVKWWVEPASNSAEDKKIADSITWNLIEGLSVPFDQFLSEAMTAVTRGFSVFEEVFQDADEKEFDGDIRWKKFGFRHQRTITEWSFDDEGDVEKMHQETEGDIERDVWIPVKKLLIFTFQKEGGDIEGISVYRSCWKDYYYKQGLQRIEAIGLERFWIGTPFIKLPRGGTKSDRDKAIDIVTKLRGDEAAGLVLPENWEFDVLRVATEGGAMSDVIGRYTRNIFLSGLAQFLALGDKAVGSWALSKDQSAFFLFALNAIADTMIAGTINKYAIPQLVKMNWPDVDVYPKLVHGDIAQIDFKAFSENLGKFVSAGFLTAPDQEIEEQIREMMGLPEMTKEMKEEQVVLDKAKKEATIAQAGAQVEMAKNGVAEVGKTKKPPKNDKAAGEKDKKTAPVNKLQEDIELVMITPEDISRAINDFNQRAPDWQKGVLEPLVLT